MPIDFRFYRGLKANLPTLAEGRPGFTTNEGKLYVGSSAGNIEMARRDSTFVYGPSPEATLNLLHTSGRYFVTSGNSGGPYVGAQGLVDVFAHGNPSSPFCRQIFYSATETTVWERQAINSEGTFGAWRMIKGEGAWTPAPMGTDSNPTGVTYGHRMGWWSRDGRIVTIQLYMLLTSIGTGGAGIFGISGLPFSNRGGRAWGSVSPTATKHDPSYGPLMAYVQENYNYILFFVPYGPRGSYSAGWADIAQNGMNIEASFSYVTDE